MYPVEVLKMFAQLCARPLNRAATSVRPAAPASCAVARSAIAYSCVSDAPLGTGEIDVACVFGTYPFARYAAPEGRSTYQP
jgi:hypothetical protein